MQLDWYTSFQAKQKSRNCISFGNSFYFNELFRLSKSSRFVGFFEKLFYLKSFQGTFFAFLLFDPMQPN